MKRILLLLLPNFFMLMAYGQKISGIVTNQKGEPLPFASITVRGTQSGAIANSKGRYDITIKEGSYTLVCQHVGYRAENKQVIVDKEITVDFTLHLQELSMEEVVIKSGTDPANEIIRQTIKKRNYYNSQVDSFTVDVYIKGLLKSRQIPEKFIKKGTDKEEMGKTGFDSLGRGILFLSESQTEVSFKKPDTYKYKVLSSRQAGGGYGISFPFFINFYVNNVNVFTNLNPRGFVSPISDQAFHFYKFRYEGSFFENGKMINRIKVTPRRKQEPLFNGYVQIIDGEWRFHSLDLVTTKDYQLQLIDTIRLTQIHAHVADDVWRPQNQVVYLAANTFGFEWTGNFLNVYTNYDLNPGFGKNHFTRTIASYDSAFNKKDSLYWSRVRPIPLEPEEQRDFVFKDSLYKKFRDSIMGRAGMDSMNRKQRKPGFNDIVYLGITRRNYSRNGLLTYRLTPLIYALQYNTVEGLAPNFTHSFQYSPWKGKKNFYVDINTRYGISNEHLNGYMTLGIRPKRSFINKYVEVSGGKRVSQFNNQNPIDPFMNTTYTLFRKKNYMKIYENWFGEFRYSNGLESGLKWNLSASYEDRIPLENTTDYSMGKKHRVFLPNHPFELAHIPFQKHQALVASLAFSFQPGQRYIDYPTGKVSIGSKYPTMELQYSKGLKDVLDSDVDFDKWKFSVWDNLNLRLGGAFQYRISIGGFLNSNRVEIPDMQHFNGNQTFPAQRYLNSFQLAPYYRYSNTEKIYALFHAEHHFNGLLTNKIPLFNKLKWTLVTGTNTFFVNRDNYYVEAFVGVENIFKLFRVDFIASYQAVPGNNFGFRLGLGGILGGALNAARKN